VYSSHRPFSDVQPNPCLTTDSVSDVMSLPRFRLLVRAVVLDYEAVDMLEERTRVQCQQAVAEGKGR
jgi:hypothetical protein